MQPTFYAYICRYVDYHAKDPMSRLASAVHQDIAFPKHSHDFDEISRHMEQSTHYSKLLSVFDDAWQKYQYII